MEYDSIKYCYLKSYERKNIVTLVGDVHHYER